MAPVETLRMNSGNLETNYMLFFELPPIIQEPKIKIFYVPYNHISINLS
jgi:hypothetical protein